MFSYDFANYRSLSYRPFSTGYRFSPGNYFPVCSSLLSWLPRVCLPCASVRSLFLKLIIEVLSIEKQTDETISRNNKSFNQLSLRHTTQWTEWRDAHFIDHLLSLLSGFKYRITLQIIQYLVWSRDVEKSITCGVRIHDTKSENEER